MARPTIQQRFGKNVKQARQQMKLTQQQLADALGLDRAYISSIEHGLKNPTLSTMQGIAKALKSKLIDLL